MDSSNSLGQRVRTIATSVWRWLRWMLLVALSAALLMLLVAIVETEVWKVFEVLVVPVSIGFGIWWLERREAEREKTEQTEQARKGIELEYRMALAELAAHYPREISNAAAKLDAISLSTLQREYKDKQSLVEKRREFQLAQLEEDKE